MADERHDLSRRRFLRNSLLGAAAVPMAGGLFAAGASAEEDMPRLSEDDPQASALNYRHDAEEIDMPPRQEGAICANCQLWTSDADVDWGGCSAFPGKLVANGGWCSAWVRAS